jgi:hypothetical protein
LKHYFEYAGTLFYSKTVGTLLQSLRYSLPPPLKKPIYLVDNSHSHPFSHEASFSAAVMKVSILGAISVVIYGIVVRYTYLPFGLWVGTIISIMISFGSSFFIHRFLTKKTL